MSAVGGQRLQEASGQRCGRDPWLVCGAGGGGFRGSTVPKGAPSGRVPLVAPPPGAAANAAKRWDPGGWVTRLASVSLTPVPSPLLSPTERASLEGEGLTGSPPSCRPRGVSCPRRARGLAVTLSGVWGSEGCGTLASCARTPDPQTPRVRERSLQAAVHRGCFGVTRRVGTITDSEVQSRAGGSGRLGGTPLLLPPPPSPGGGAGGDDLESRRGCPPSPRCAARRWLSPAALGGRGVRVAPRAGDRKVSI